MDGKSHSQAKRGALLGGASHLDERFPAFQVKAAPPSRCGGKLGVVHLGKSSQQTGEKSIFERNGALLEAMRPTLWEFSAFERRFPPLWGGSPTLEVTALPWWHGGKRRDRRFRGGLGQMEGRPHLRRESRFLWGNGPTFMGDSPLFRKIGPTLGKSPLR